MEAGRAKSVPRRHLDLKSFTVTPVNHLFFLGLKKSQQDKTNFLHLRNKRFEKVFNPLFIFISSLSLDFRDEWPSAI